ncbi:MAG: DUF1800 domain-containing protein [Cyanobacteria bacterium P01_D01_bin.123]
MDSFAQTAHLYRRLSFGGTLAELNAAATPQNLIHDWLQRPPALVQLPAFEPIRRNRDASPEQRRQNRQKLRLQGRRLGGWLLEQMATAANPLHEAIAGFWRDHFVVSLQKFNLPAFIGDYDLRLRAHAMGDFHDLLWSVTTSPAMLLYLDNQQNRVGNLNENFSREVLELFTIGPGQYSERDIREGARALTGRTIDVRALRSGRVESSLRRFRHDGVSKTFLGHTGHLQTEDVVEILANHPSTARHLSEKLWSYFAYPNPDPELVQKLADVFIQSDRNIAAWVEAAFSQPEFWSDRAYRSQIKSPLAFTLGAIRQLGIEADYSRVLLSLRSMGQIPYMAPSVKGWPSSEGWLDTRGLLGRLDLARQMTRDRNDDTPYRFQPGALTRTDLSALLLDGSPLAGWHAAGSDLALREVAALCLSSPLYQLA